MARPSVTTSVASGSNRNRAVLMLAAVFGILSAMLMFAFLNSRGGDSSAVDKALNSGQGAETVVVAAKDIEVGTTITADMLATKTVPGAALLNGRTDKAEPLVGRVATSSMYAGEQVLDQKTTTYEGQSTLAYKVPKGYRALSLTVPHEAWIAAGLPQPGDRIDILGITTLVRTDPLTGQERPDVVSGYLVQDVEVLAVSQSVIKTVTKVPAKVDPNKPLDGATPAASATAAASGTAAASTGASEAVKGSEETYEKAISITLALKPDDAAKAALLDALKDEVGQFRIVVRQKGDSEILTGTTLWSFDELFPKKK